MERAVLHAANFSAGYSADHSAELASVAAVIDHGVMLFAAFVDKETHQTVYHNTRTNESSWDKPPAFTQPSSSSSSGSSSSDAAVGETTFQWVMYVDATTSQPYHVNLVTNATLWQKPTEFDGVVTADDVQRMSCIHEPTAVLLVLLLLANQTKERMTKTTTTKATS